MTSPTYENDLTTMTNAESGTFYELTDWAQGTLQTVPETDYFIQGAGCVSSTVKTILNSIAYDNGSGITVPADGAVMIWQFSGVPSVLDTYANGGMRVAIGSDQGDFNMWYSGGNDRFPNPYGGWQNVAVDPTVSADDSTGSPTTDLRWFGLCQVLPTSYPSKGAPFGLDAIRYGRCSIQMTGGDTDGYATFAGLAAYNDANNSTDGFNRLGIFQDFAGNYLWKGRLVFGTTAGGATDVVDFRDSNVSILVDDTPKASTAFTLIEINDASSRVDWTNVIFAALGSNTRGNFEVVDDADINFDSCQFTDMGTFTFQSNSVAQDCTFRRCDQVVGAGGDFTGSNVTGYIGDTDTSAFVWNVATDPDGKLDNMTFVQGTNSHHAIEFGTASSTDFTLRGITFTGFDVTDSDTGAVLYIKRTTGTVNVGAVGCSGTITYKTDGADVTITQGVAVTVNVQDIQTSTDIEDARVLMTVSSTDGGFPYQESVSMTRTGSTVDVAHTSHGMSTGDWVVISGATEGEYNGVHQITYVDADNYQYTLSTSPTSPATGSPVATLAIIHATTGASGTVTNTRTYAADQGFSGRVRYYGAGEYNYKTQPISGTIDSGSGASITVSLIRD